MFGSIWHTIVILLPKLRHKNNRPYGMYCYGQVHFLIGATSRKQILNRLNGSATVWSASTASECGSAVCHQVLQRSVDRELHLYSDLKARSEIVATVMMLALTSQTVNHSDDNHNKKISRSEYRKSRAQDLLRSRIRPRSRILRSLVVVSTARVEYKISYGEYGRPHLSRTQDVLRCVLPRLRI